MENKSSRVLIVDDMLANRIILASLLASSGVASDQVATGKECLQLCSEKDYDLILLDHRMPDLDGIDTFIRLKEIFENKKRSVPVVCHTTEEGRKNINLYKAAGFADVLLKPIDPKQLSEILLTYITPHDEETKKAGEEAAEIEKEQEEIHIQDELDKLPLWLKSTVHIDLVQGITNCETAEDYMDALTIFASSIAAKIDEILTFCEKRDYSMYTMRVHSLKSVSSLIGARKLCELATSMEQAGKAGKYNIIRTENKYLIEEYYSFLELLSPLIKTEEAEKEAEETEKVPETENALEKKKILFIEGTSSISNKGITHSLKKAGFDVVICEPDPGKIISYRSDTDIIVYYPGDDERSRISVIMNHLAELCLDDTKFLCLVGESYDLEYALSCAGAERVSKTYTRPVDIEKFVTDIEQLSEVQERFHKKKFLFVVDDDSDFLKIMENWLSPVYNVNCFSNAADVLNGLLTFTPDLILLDYEMPGMDGFELMQKIKSDPDTREIPIIFLTGKNDRDHVFKILENRPDGYLLKSSSKESLTDAIGRFFSESVFKASLD